jgi:hypothetical protein
MVATSRKRRLFSHSQGRLRGAVPRQFCRKLRELFRTQWFAGEEFTCAIVENLAVPFEDRARRPEGDIDQILDDAIDRLGGTVAVGPRPLDRGLADKEAAGFGFIRDLPEFRRHAEADDHVAVAQARRRVVDAVRSFDQKLGTDWSVRALTWSVFSFRERGSAVLTARFNDSHRKCLDADQMRTSRPLLMPLHESGIPFGSDKAPSSDGRRASAVWAVRRPARWTATGRI